MRTPWAGSECRRVSAEARADLLVARFFLRRLPERKGSLQLLRTHDHPPAHIMDRRPTSGTYKPHPAADGPLAASQHLSWKDFVELNTAQGDFNAPPGELRIYVAWALEDFTLFAMLREAFTAWSIGTPTAGRVWKTFRSPWTPRGRTPWTWRLLSTPPTSRTRFFVTPAAA